MNTTDGNLVDEVDAVRYAYEVLCNDLWGELLVPRLLSYDSSESIDDFSGIVVGETLAIESIDALCIDCVHVE